MGKKTKELSVAIAESSSTEAQNITPRKRGRPRKIIKKSDGKEEEQQTTQVFGGNDSKRVKINEEGDDNKQKKLEDDIKEEIEGSTSKSNKDEGKFEDKELLIQPRRSRRKSKPRKSS